MKPPQENNPPATTHPGQRGFISYTVHVLKTNASKFTSGLEPLFGDACSAKSSEVLTLVFSTDCNPIDWLQSVLKITRFENVFLFFSFLKIRCHVRGGVKLEYGA